MAFWNRKKRKKQAEEYAKLEAEARERFEEIRAERIRQAKEEKEKLDAETQAEEAEAEKKDLYETEIRLPVMKNDRERYVAECCSSIREVDRQIEGIREEYAKVTDGLMDIQKIDRFTGEDKKALLEASKNIVSLSKERNQYKNRNLTISEVTMRRFEPFEDELVDEIKKMYEAEKYQELVQGDIELLKQEKHNLRKEKQEIIEKQNSLKVFAVILLGFCVALFLLFGILYLVLKADMTYPYFGTLLFAAISATIIFVESNRNRRSMSIADRKMDKAIGLLNRVKIKCVNNLNVLEYCREKFGVKSAEEFETLWNEYCKAKEYERKFRENTEQLNYYCDALVTLLRKHELKDSEIWTSQAIAIIDNREMVEIRHKLNSRRQLLRSRIEYNENVKQEFLHAIDDLIRENPESRDKLMKIVEKSI